MKRTISAEVGKGSVSHNSRKFRAENVDGSRTHLNIDYCNERIQTVYYQLFDEALKRYNEKQARADRRISNYYEKIRSGNQEKPFHEIILQIGNKEDMLSMVSTRELVTEDTPENREQAYYDMAWLTENMLMRNRTHGGYKVLLDELWEFCEQFNADMVIFWEHMSCKALDGMHGLFEERAREHGIHLVWVTHDLFDPRVISRQGVRQQVNDYMRTVMQEEPVDPSLEILKDEKSW